MSELRTLCQKENIEYCDNFLLILACFPTTGFKTTRCKDNHLPESGERRSKISKTDSRGTN